MDPESLTVGGMVAALVLKAAEKTGDQAAASAFAAIGRLVERVRNRFKDHGDLVAQEALTRVEDPPAGPAHLAALAAAVDRHAGEDMRFAEELRRLIVEAESAGVAIHHITQEAKGSGISQIQGVTGSTISVNIGEARGGKQTSGL